MKNLFVDDLRTMESVYRSIARSWNIVRSYEDFEVFIRNNPVPSFISFDHDLGANPDGSIAKSGMDCAKLLVELDMDNIISIPPDFTFRVHSSNPNGRDNIQGYLDGYLKFRKNND